MACRRASYKADACYEVAMGSVGLDEGPVGIILSYLQ
jgi:hypothetical protein